MPRETSYPQGTPSWVDLSTTDVPAAKEFYASLFGWEYEDHQMGPEMMFALAKVDGGVAGVIFTQHGEEKEMGAPPHWNVYVSVDDVDEVAGKVEELGGKLIAGPFDVPQPGRMCVVQDPSGGFVQFWQPGEGAPVRIREEHGSLCWAELLTEDQAGAEEFFTELLGVGLETEAMPTPEDGDYHMLMAGDYPAAGIMDLPQELIDQGVPAHWEAYFRVDDAKSVVEKATAQGGQVVFGPEVMPMVGTIAVFMDPQGAVFGIQEPEAG